MIKVCSMSVVVFSNETAKVQLSCECRKLSPNNFSNSHVPKKFNASLQHEQRAPNVKGKKGTPSKAYVIS